MSRMKNCVECGIETIEHTHADVVVEACPQGHGMWLLERDLLAAVRTQDDGSSIGNTYEEGRSLSLAADRDIEPGDAERTCPVCREPMGSVRYAFTTDVIVDVCARHGVWLDPGELEALEAWAAERADPDSEAAKARSERLARIASGEVATETITVRPSLLDALRAFKGRRLP
ncbi:MAG: hypothetical protein JWM86_2048 [Thermoleophilia bacterium]|nr:hypothetical protein [Thermoleophilia bacterium]